MDDVLKRLLDAENRAKQEVQTAEKQAAAIQDAARKQTVEEARKLEDELLAEAEQIMQSAVQAAEARRDEVQGAAEQRMTVRIQAASADVEPAARLVMAQLAYPLSAPRASTAADPAPQEHGAARL